MFYDDGVIIAVYLRGTFGTFIFMNGLVISMSDVGPSSIVATL
jgi:hypothetical protein